MKLETKCIHAGYDPENGQPGVPPIVQSTTYKYSSVEDMAKLFDLEKEGFFYSRIANPTVNALEEKIAALEGGAAAICVSSGQAALMITFLNLLKSGDHVVSATNIYGGTMNLLAVLFRKYGIETTFINQNDGNDILEKAIRPNTRFIFGETIANPALSVLDIERFAKLAHDHGIPLIVDNTFATPVLCRPFEHGADIIVHSTTKYMDGHAVQMGGAIVDSGNFNWRNGKFPEFTDPDESYHGLIYTENFGSLAYIVKARAQLIRDMGCLQTPQGAFYTNLGLETLPLRMRQHSANALAAARWLKERPEIESVSYPGLGDNPLAKKYLPQGASGVINFVMRGGRKAAERFIDGLKLITLETHVADIKSAVLHPASSTHRQLNDEQLHAAGIVPGMVRFSVGLENIEDIVNDLEQALLPD